MWTRSTFIHDYVPGLFGVAVDSYDMFNKTQKVWDRICKVKTSSKQKEEKAYRSTLGHLQRKAEGVGISYDIQIGGPKKTWTHDVYALGVRISEEAISDNLYELKGGGQANPALPEMFKDLGLSAAEHPEVKLAEMFNNATSTTYHTAADGLAIASTAHKRLDGSTYSNKATSSDLTYSTFWTNVIALENQYDHRQKRVKMKCVGVLVPPQGEQKAVEIVKSKDRPDTANRAVSAIAKTGRGGIEIIVWPYLTDPDMWVLIGDNHDLIWFKRWNTRFAKEGDFETSDIKVKVVRRDSCEMGDPRGMYWNIP